MTAPATVADIEQAITDHLVFVRQFAPERGGHMRSRDYAWHHEQINTLLDDRDHLLNELAAESLARNSRRVGLRRILGT